MMVYILLISAGAGVGAVLRFSLSSWFTSTLGQSFPYGTLFVNISGSMAIGALFVFMAGKPLFEEIWKPLLFIGLLGGFTTFSAFAIETLRLIENGNLLLAMANILGNVFLCVSACWVGCQGAKIFVD
ncbi:MAG: fluoride efflux transporter CrcB [Gammaproteobacteria bacterium]|jgi:CrcB protein